ncbi:hypothetical protein [Lentzea albidocapillata]|uniref:Uncharacterized protein n=1 Tax=Lentzea albidocapillata TaxID=40571 RepID=A0A1W2AZY6_9PSEU|nr:hypothetical protein [Lentzea albidocapillata]SMC66285.1 hypothetical protein SAMN05660733_00859 [Lentzea albidocapillata]
MPSATAQGVPFAALDSLKALVDQHVDAGRGQESPARAVESLGVASQRFAG